MDHLVECDQQFDQESNEEQTNECEETKNFIERSFSIPIVSGTFFYVAFTYNTVKGKNVFLGSVMGVIENIVSKTASVTFGVTQKVVNYNYFDNLACKGLDKIENAIPFINKQSDEIVKDSREYILNKISGVSDSSKAPDTVIGAFTIRKQNLELWLSQMLWNNKASQTILTALNKVVDKTERFVDSILPRRSYEISLKECRNETTALQKISCLASKTKRRFIFLSREVNKEETRGKIDEVTVRDLTSVTKHLLSNYYKRSMEKPENEKFTSKVLRLSLSLSVGVMLICNGIIDASWPRIKNFVASVFVSVKKSSAQIINPLENAVGKVVGPMKSASARSLEIIMKKSEEAITYVDKLYHNLPEIIRKLADSAQKHRNESLVPLTSQSNFRPSYSDTRTELSKENTTYSLTTNKYFQDSDVTESSTPDFVSLLDSEEEEEECKENSEEVDVELLEDNEGFFCDANETILLSCNDSSFCSTDATLNKSYNSKIKKIFKWPKF